MKPVLTLLAALLLVPLVALQAADKPAKPNPDQSAGVDPDNGKAPRPEKTVPPRLIPNPNSTEDYARAKRTCSGVPSLAVSRGGRLWAAWFSGTTPGEIIERCPHAYVVVSTSGDGGKTWKEVLAIDPDGAGPLKAYDPHPWIDPDGKLWVFFTLPFPLHKHAWAIKAEDGDQESPAWSSPRPVFEGPLLNRPTGLTNGDWLFPTYARRPQNMKGIGESVSNDGGTTWSPLKVPAIQHTSSRFFIGRLQSGNLLLVKHLRIDEDPLSAGKPKQRRELTAFLSKDYGKTWTGGLVLDERVGCSYPDIQQTPDGTLYMVWDFMRSRDQEILMTTFREDGVLAANDEAAARVKTNRKLVSKGGTP